MNNPAQPAKERPSQTLLAKLKYWWLTHYVAPTEHEEILDHAKSEGELSSRYSFMVIVSCAIAMLGLLLSSPAVVIGAMLVSPLMGPIMSLGFSLCVLNMRQMRKALLGVITGFIMAVAISWVIVTLSPITDATPEILSRTQPNLFDLLVAVFSGLAGGYAVIKRKGETIVGVAIATALMPPLAVVGYGLAMGNAAVYGGAFMLFMTNLLAISLSVSILAKLYGFGARHNKRGQTFWQALLVIGTFTALSIPLGVALKSIAYQTYVTQTTKHEIAEVMGAKSRLSHFHIDFGSDENSPLVIDSVVLSSKFNDDAEATIQKKLQNILQKDVQLKLDQIVVAKGQITTPLTTAVAGNHNTLSAPAIAGIGIATSNEKNFAPDTMLSKLKQVSFFPTEFIEVEAAKKQAVIHPKIGNNLTLATLRQFETSLKTKFPDWKISVKPTIQAFPSIEFMTGKDTPTAQGEATLEDIYWALQSWGVTEVDVIGYASTVGEYNRFDNRSLAFRRANYVTNKLDEIGILANPIPQYHYATQKKNEREYGTKRYHRVEVRLAQPARPIP